MHASPQEMEWIGRIVAGERELFHELIRPYERAVYMAAFSLLRDAAEAEDAAQETMLKAYRALARFRGDSKFSTWLVSIAINEARSRLRGRKGVLTESLDAPADGSAESDRGAGAAYTPFLLADWREIPSEAFERTELATQIEQAIDTLPPAYREVFLLRDKEEMSIEEIAQAVGVTSNLVKVRLFRARMLLQRELAPYLKLQAPVRRGYFSRLKARAGRRDGGQP